MLYKIWIFRHILKSKEKLLYLKYYFQDRITDLNNQADKFIDSGVWDAESIEVRKRTINERYDK